METPQNRKSPRLQYLIDIQGRFLKVLPFLQVVSAEQSVRARSIESPTCLGVDDTSMQELHAEASHVRRGGRFDGRKRWCGSGGVITTPPRTPFGVSFCKQVEFVLRVHLPRVIRWNDIQKGLD